VQTKKLPVKGDKSVLKFI